MSAAPRKSAPPTSTSSMNIREGATIRGHVAPSLTTLASAPSARRTGLAKVKTLTETTRPSASAMNAACRASALACCSSYASTLPATSAVARRPTALKSDVESVNTWPPIPMTAIDCAPKRPTMKVSTRPTNVSRLCSSTEGQASASTRRGAARPARRQGNEFEVAQKIPAHDASQPGRPAPPNAAG